jgi:hypothetical protein
MPKSKFNINDFFSKSNLSKEKAKSTYFIYNDFISKNIVEKNFDESFKSLLKEYLTSKESEIIFQTDIDSVNDNKRRQVVFSEDQSGENKWKQLYKTVNKIILSKLNNIMTKQNSNSLLKKPYKITTTGLFSMEGCEKQNLHSDNDNRNKCTIIIIIICYL